MQTLLNWLVGSKVLPRNAQIKADYSYLNLCKLTPHVRGIFPKTFDYTYSCFERNKVELDLCRLSSKRPVKSTHPLWKESVEMFAVIWMAVFVLGNVGTRLLTSILSTTICWSALVHLPQPNYLLICLTKIVHNWPIYHLSFESNLEQFSYQVTNQNWL